MRPSFIHFQLTACALATTVLMSACGGGGGDGASPPADIAAKSPLPTVIGTSGVAVDDYIIGGTVVCDTVKNGVFDSGEPSVTTDANGLFRFTDVCASNMFLTGGKNKDTGLSFVGKLRAPLGSTVLSPLTTLMVDGGMSTDEIATALGLPTGTNVTTLDPASKKNGVLENPDLFRKTLAVQQVLQKTAEDLVHLKGSGDVKVVFSQAAAAMAGTLRAGKNLVSVGGTINNDTVEAVVKATVQTLAVPNFNPDSLAKTMSGGYAEQAKKILEAKDASAITAATKTQQSSSKVLQFIKDNKDALKTEPSAKTAELQNTLITQIRAQEVVNTPAPAPAPTPAPAPCSTDTQQCISFSEAHAGANPFGALVSADVIDDAGNKVLKIVKGSTGEPWAGATVYTAVAGSGDKTSRTLPTIGLGTSKVVKLRVKSGAVIGARISLKLENSLNKDQYVITDVVTTKQNEWETLSFDFANISGGTVDGNATYNMASVFPAFKEGVGFSPMLAGNTTFLFDDLMYAVAAATPAPAPAPPAIPDIPGWRLVWNDEFSVDGLPDSKKWAYDTHRNKDGWYNNELQYYSHTRSENARAEGGKLIITARKERLTTAADYGNQNYTSARLYTKGKANWTYGRWEIRAKLPCALGTWPAIWMLGDGIPDTGTWPLDGEIDIMEQKGFDAGEKTRVLGTVHTQAFHAGGGKGATTSLPTACTDFHVYQMEWDADEIRIGVNGVFYFTYVNPKNGNVNEWPFSRPQHLLLNIAVGGILGGTVRDDQLPAQMEIDYVRVYQRYR